MTVDNTPEAVENLWRFWANKAQALADENKALSAALTAAKAETAAAYEAGRAGTHLRLSIARKIGMYGCAYDGPYDARAYTYEHLPGNQDAYGIGKAASNASKDRAGDHIDVGLSLLRHMNDAGFGVFALNKHDTLHALSAAKAETAAAYDAAASHVAHRFGTVTVPEAIRALTPADSKAALDRMIADARADGMMESAKIANECSEIAIKKLAKTKGMGERLAWWITNARSNMAHDLILEAIPKGKDHD